MSGYNHVTLVGNLIKDPEISKIGKRTKTTFTIGVERYAGKDTGPELDFFNVVTWGKLADITAEYLKQGKKLLVDGRIQVRFYEVDKQRKWITEIIAENIKFLTGKQPATTVAK
jgi:single-strand DNA-binding protein